MENKFYNENFERFLRGKSDQFRMYPSKRVWHSIYNDLHPGRKWPSIAMSMLLIIALMLIGYLNTNDNNAKTITAGNRTFNNGRLASNSGNGFMQYFIPANNNKQVQPNSINANDLTQYINNISTDLTNDESTNPHSELTAANDPQTTRNRVDKNIVQSVNDYIQTNQLLYDVAAMNRNNEFKKMNAVNIISGKDEVLNNTTAETDNTTLTNNLNKISIPELPTIGKTTAAVIVPNQVAKTNLSVNNKSLNTEDKAWMEDYALHNRSVRKKWKDRVAMELYATPGIGYRHFSSNAKTDAATTTLLASTGVTNTDKNVSQKPSLGLEAGFGLTYSFTKNIRLKGGVQLNYTSYGVNADQTNHPIQTTIMLNDPNTGRPYLSARTSTLSNSYGLQPVTVHNKTYQISLPVGVALKLAGNAKMEWYAGASIQPSFVFGGATHFISSDYNNYVSDISLLRKWNMNAGVETYLSYKLGAYSLQVGPQFRYQLLSTYTNKYTLNEHLYNMGLKVGVVKGF